LLGHTQRVFYIGTSASVSNYMIVVLREEKDVKEKSGRLGET